MRRRGTAPRDSERPESVALVSVHLGRSHVAQREARHPLATQRHWSDDHPREEHRCSRLLNARSHRSDHHADEADNDRGFQPVLVGDKECSTLEGIGATNRRAAAQRRAPRVRTAARHTASSHERERRDQLSHPVIVEAHQPAEAFSPRREGLVVRGCGLRREQPVLKPPDDCARSDHARRTTARLAGSGSCSAGAPWRR